MNRGSRVVDFAHIQVEKPVLRVRVNESWRLRAVSEKIHNPGA